MHIKECMGSLTIICSKMTLLCSEYQATLVILASYFSEKIGVKFLLHKTA